jgi:hypothetical protein
VAVDIVLMDLKKFNLVMNLRCNFSLLCIFFCHFIMAQFPGAAGTAGSTAIFKDSSIFVAWANSCKVQRGFQNIADTSLGYTSTGDSSLAIGPVDGIQVVSLGDGGNATLGFEIPISNGNGFDFAVFENGFIDEFLELAFVEVSSDGVNFFRFKSTSNTQTDLQVGPFDYNANPTLMNNLAGKYRAMFGTPFDLEELAGINGLDINAITHVRVVDVVGSINPNFASYDQNNNIINEHYPTPYPQGGFDLDGVGVIHNAINSLNKVNKSNFQLFPNPSQGSIKINIQEKLIKCFEMIDYSGKRVFSTTIFSSNNIDISGISEGIYICKITLDDGNVLFQKVVKQ